MPWQEIAKVKAKGVYSQSVEDVFIKHDGHYFKFCIKTIQKVCRPVLDFSQVGLPRGRSDKTITSSKTIGKLLEQTVSVFLNQRLTKNHKSIQVTNRHCSCGI